MAARADDAGPHRYFLVDELPALLREAAEREPPDALADLGAGDGSLLYGLDRAGLLGEAHAVDLSHERVALCESLSPRIRGVVGDATATPLASASVDAVVASQLIEHLRDDRALAPEIARVLRPRGWFYVSSVVRGRRAWWIYRRDGRWWTDPTHIREYEHPDAFVRALEHPELTVERVRVVPLRFAVTDLAARALAFARVLRFATLPELYVRAPALARMRRLTVRVPGYWWIEATGRRS